MRGRAGSCITSPAVERSGGALDNGGGPGATGPARSRLVWLALATLGVWVGFAANGAAAYQVDPNWQRTVVLGRSLDGRTISAVETGDFGSPRKILVVGCIHGDECAGTAIAAELSRMRPPPEVDLWVVADLNPDGAAAGTRGNARGVDLNRNFPWVWKRLGGVFDSGPRPLSEPESRIAYRLISRLRPTISIWFHQRLDLVDESGGNVTLERRFAALAGLRLGRLQREPGSVVGWENHSVRSGTSFVVELPGGPLSRMAAARFARAVVMIARGGPLDGAG